MRRRSLLAAAAFAAAAPAFADAASAAARAGLRRGPSPAAWRGAWSDVERAFAHDLAADGVVGGAMAFRRRGETLGFATYGAQDAATGNPIDRETIFHWASQTKTFTAIAFMQLRDRGLVKLDDPAVRYCPELAQIHNPFGPPEQITLRHLITHTSGLRGATFPWGGDKPWHPHEPARWAQVADMMPYTEVEFAPGSRYSYSNPGMSLVGRVVEAVSGDIYQQYVEKNVLSPLGMTRSYFDATPRHLQAHRGHNYTIQADGRRVDEGVEVLTAATVANGGLNTPLEDYLKYTDFLLGHGDAALNETVLSRSTLQEMWKPLNETDDSEPPRLAESMGEAFFVIDLKDGPGAGRYIGHTGSQEGYRSFFYIHPPTGAAVVWAVNTRPVAHPRPMLRAQRLKILDTLFPLFSA